MFKKALCFVVALGCMAISTGCASGGYKLTRKYSQFVNRQHIILRIVLYILTGVVYAVTLLIDAVVFNTIDFWEGRVSQGTYNFDKDGKLYAVTHEFQGESKLRKSTIKITNTKDQKTQEIILKELSTGEVEYYLDGQLKSKAESHKDFAIVSEFDQNGSVVKRMPVDLNRQLLASDASRPQSL